MPKRHASRPISERGEDNLAKRIERERTKKGMSYEQLAAAMTDAGCAITKAALRSIEKGTPRRRITVDEQLAFAEIFTDGDLLDLLRPIELVDQDRAHSLQVAIEKSEQAIATAAVSVFEASADMLDLAADRPDLAEYVLNRWMSGPAANVVPDELAGDHSAEARLIVHRLIDADSTHTAAIRDAAGIWAAYRAGRWSGDQHAQVLAELDGAR